MPHTHTCWARRRKHNAKDTHTRTHTQRRRNAPCVLFLFPCGFYFMPRGACVCARTHTHKLTVYTTWISHLVAVTLHRGENVCGSPSAAAPPEPPISGPDYFIMNPNLGCMAASSDRFPGPANVLGYFWQRSKPTKHWELSH